MTESQKLCKECGEHLSGLVLEKPLKKKMDQMINLLGKVSHRDIIDEVILICLQKEVDAQCLINVLNAGEDEQKKSLQYFFAGYTSK